MERSIDLKDLESYLKEREEAEAFSGLVRIQQKEEILFEGAYGWANRTWKIRPDLDTRFRIASLSKIFTAIAIGQLADENHFAFSDSAVDLLGLEDSVISKSVTIEHLLTHSSGIGDYFDEINGSDEDWFALWEETPIYQMKSLEDYYAIFKNQPAAFSPGEKFQYCGAGYILLGMVIEKVTARDYRDVIQSRIFDALAVCRWRRHFHRVRFDPL